MMLDFSDFNVSLPIVLIVAICGVTMCSVSAHWASNSNERHRYELQKACVMKTGNPDCKEPKRP